MRQRVGVRRLRLLEGARAASGHAVMIDVMRAATSCAYALAGGAARLVIVETSQAAFQLRDALYREALLVGESDGVKIEGFDLDNSPTLLERAELGGRIVLMRTSAGTRGALLATKAQAVYLAGFVNAAATARTLEARQAGVASLVAMGQGGVAPAEEDEACASYVESILRGRPLSGEALANDVLRRKRGGWQHPAPTFLEDVERAFAVDRFDFAIEVVRVGGHAEARRLAA